MKLSDADLARLYPSMHKAPPAPTADVARRLYPNTPSMWGKPTPPPPLPEQELRFYPASPAMWGPQIAARAAALKVLAAGGDRDAAKELADLPGAVAGALASNPQAADSVQALDLVAGLMEPNR